MSSGDDSWLKQRGEYWITRLAAKYDITMRYGAWRFGTLTRQQLTRYGATYGVTFMQPAQVFIQDQLLQLRVVDGDKKAVPLIDEMLVHELIHASGVSGHGAEFKKRYGKVYPWSSPGPVTEFDSGTPRRVLWSRITRRLP